MHGRNWFTIDNNDGVIPYDDDNDADDTPMTIKAAQR